MALFFISLHSIYFERYIFLIMWKKIDKYLRYLYYSFIYYFQDYRFNVENNSNDAHNIT